MSAKKKSNRVQRKIARHKLMKGLTKSSKSGYKFKGQCMSLTRYYEICCDTCKYTDHYVGNAAYVMTQAKAHGWIEAEDGKHYCGVKCRDKMPHKRKIIGTILDEWARKW